MIITNCLARQLLHGLGPAAAGHGRRRGRHRGAPAGGGPGEPVYIYIYIYIFAICGLSMCADSTTLSPLHLAVSGWLACGGQGKRLGDRGCCCYHLPWKRPRPHMRAADGPCLIVPCHGGLPRLAGSMA